MVSQTRRIHYWAFLTVQYGGIYGWRGSEIYNRSAYHVIYFWARRSRYSYLAVLLNRTLETYFWWLVNERKRVPYFGIMSMINSLSRSLPRSPLSMMNCPRLLTHSLTHSLTGTAPTHIYHRPREFSWPNSCFSKSFLANIQRLINTCVRYKYPASLPCLYKDRKDSERSNGHILSHPGSNKWDQYTIIQIHDTWYMIHDTRCVAHNRSRVWLRNTILRHATHISESFSFLQILYFRFDGRDDVKRWWCTIVNT